MGATRLTWSDHNAFGELAATLSEATSSSTGQGADSVFLEVPHWVAGHGLKGRDVLGHKF